MKRLLLLATLAQGACSGLFQTHDVAPAVYTLNGASLPPAPGAIQATLSVARPSARPGLDDERIAVRLPDHRLDAYAGARWSGPLPRLVEALIVDGFRASNGWRAVVSESSAFPGRYLLQTEIVDFAADYGGGAPLVHVVLRAELGRSAGRELVASLEAKGEARAAADRQRDVAAAFEAAADQAVAALVAAANAAALAAEAR